MALPPEVASSPRPDGQAGIYLGEEALPRGSGHPGADPPQVTVGQRIGTALAARGLGRIDTLVAVGRSNVELRQLTVPPAPDDELPQMVHFQALREFNALEEDWPLDFMPLDDASDQPRNVLAAAIDPARVAQIEATCQAAGLKPRLRSHMEIHRLHYRGELWCVLQDHASGRVQRFSPAAYPIIGLMDGKRTVQQIWDRIRERLGAEAPTQEEVIRLLSQLHAVDALQADVMPDTSELIKRSGKQRHGKLKQNLRSPLFMRFPLFDPERLLTRLQWLVRPFFGWAGALLWLAVVGWAVFQAGIQG